MENNFGALFAEIKKDLRAYLDIRLKILQLDVMEKTSVTSSLLLYVLIMLFVFFFTMLFLFLALGLYLGELFQNNAAGMGIVAFLYLLAILILLAKRASIQSRLVNFFLGELMKKEEKNKFGNE